jgi:hypothetical protein
VLRFAPIPIFPERNRKLLSDQFVYRFNNNIELGIVHAVIEFNPQLIYHLMAVSQKLAEEMRTSSSLREASVHRCTLKSRPEPADNNQ